MNAVSVAVAIRKHFHGLCVVGAGGVAAVLMLNMLGINCDLYLAISGRKITWISQYKSDMNKLLVFTLALDTCNYIWNSPMNRDLSLICVLDISAYFVKLFLN